jgi:hypothetical protein
LFKKGKLSLQWKDIILKDNNFIREIGNNSYHFKDKELILARTEKVVKFISKIKPAKKIDNKFLTLDIETMVDDNKHIPYCVCIFDGGKCNSFYLSDYSNNPELMLTKAIESILLKKYDNYRIYIHNLSNFDGIFLLKILVNVGIISPFIKNGQIIQIQLNYGGSLENVIYFRDSYQMLLSSLANLGKSFNVNTQKGIFPYKFPNRDNLNYVGEVPEFKYFTNITYIQYFLYKMKYLNWSLKDVTISYCSQDCISLFEIVKKFNTIIFNKYKININKYPTLPSLTFGIYRAHYLVENTIPQISGQIYRDIRKSYTGGSVDMFIPTSDTNEEVYAYDVNSLYPSVMRDNDMPIGKVHYFEGNIRNVDLDAFGFFYCKIETPDNLNHPIIQKHIKTNGGIRTISPLGNFEGMIFSSEMDNAMRFGYKFEIL